MSPPPSFSLDGSPETVNDSATTRRGSMEPLHSARTILLATALYFAVCGVSAVVAPSLWLWASGLPTSVSTELGLTFGVIGAYLCALAVGAVIASVDPRRHGGLIITLIVANIFDFGVTLRAVIAGTLPALNGALFVAVTIVWSTLLSIAWWMGHRIPARLQA